MKKGIFLILVLVLLSGCVLRDGTNAPMPANRGSDEETSQTEVSSSYEELIVNETGWMIDGDNSTVYKFLSDGTGSLIKNGKEESLTYYVKDDTLTMALGATGLEYKLSGAADKLVLTSDEEVITLVPYKENTEVSSSEDSKESSSDSSAESSTSSEDYTDEKLISYLINYSPWQYSQNEEYVFTFKENNSGTVLTLSDNKEEEMSYSMNEEDTLNISFGLVNMDIRILSYSAEKINGSLNDAEFTLVPYKEKTVVSLPKQNHPEELLGAWIGKDSDEKEVGIYLSESVSGYLVNTEGNWQLNETNLSWVAEGSILTLGEDTYEYVLTDDTLVLVNQKDQAVWALKLTDVAFE